MNRSTFFATITSRHRDRNKYPNPFNFVTENIRMQNYIRDRVSTGAPLAQFRLLKEDQEFGAKMTSWYVNQSGKYTLCFDASSLPAKSLLTRINALRGAHIKLKTIASAIQSSRLVGTDTLVVDLELTHASFLTVPPRDISFHIPAGFVANGSAIDGYYDGMSLYNSTRNSSSKITSYIGGTRTFGVKSLPTDWKTDDIIDIRDGYTPLIVTCVNNAIEHSVIANVKELQGIFVRDSTNFEFVSGNKFKKQDEKLTSHSMLQSGKRYELLEAHKDNAKELLCTILDFKREYRMKNIVLHVPNFLFPRLMWLRLPSKSNPNNNQITNMNLPNTSNSTSILMVKITDGRYEPLHRDKNLTFSPSHNNVMGFTLLDYDTGKVISAIKDTSSPLEPDDDVQAHLSFVLEDLGDA